MTLLLLSRTSQVLTVLAFILKQRTIRNRKGRGSDPILGTLCSVLASMFCIVQDIWRTGLGLTLWIKTLVTKSDDLRSISGG